MRALRFRLLLPFALSASLQHDWFSRLFEFFHCQKKVQRDNVIIARAKKPRDNPTRKTTQNTIRDGFVRLS